MFLHSTSTTQQPGSGGSSGQLGITAHSSPAGWTGITGGALGATGNSGADAYGRPKSAGLGTAAPVVNNMSTTGSRGSGGVAMVGTRPPSSQDPMKPGVTGSSNGGGVTPGNMNSNNNTLSYGSLKNRFLSGSKSKSGSKLFSLR